MSTLHIVNQTSSHDALSACLRIALGGDSLLLIEDGVYQVSQIAAHPEALKLTLFALQEDVAARGLSLANLPVIITPIDYTQFVELVCQHQRSVSWF